MPPDRRTTGSPVRMLRGGHDSLDVFLDVDDEIGSRKAILQYNPTRVRRVDVHRQSCEAVTPTFVDYRARDSAPAIEEVAGKELEVIITVSGRHMDVTPALKTFAEEKAGKLTRYYDRIQEIEVIFDAQKGGTSVEMIVNAEHNDMFIARNNEGDAYAQVDACVDKLERQLSEHKKRHRNRKHPE